MTQQQEHKTIAANTLATDQGEFTAIAAAWTKDREGDVIQRGAFANTIKAWRRSGKQIPLHWNHKGDPESIIGHLDPQTMQETDEGLLVKGQLDLENSETARDVWRLVKANTVGLSFGYLVPEGGEVKRADGRDLTDLDVFEFSITAAPMHPDTRILSAKALEEKATELRRATERQHRELIASDLPKVKQAPAGGEPTRMLQSMLEQGREYCSTEQDPEDVQTMQDIMEQLRMLGAKDAAEAGKGMRLLAIPGDEYALLQDTEFKAVWTTAYINSLPDSSFLYIEPGGSKDGEGKTTPRSLRHFPYKDASGAVDLPHLRNALARIPQSNLPQSVKDSCTAKAQRMMDAQKSLDDGQEDKPRSVDPARRRIEQALLNIQLEGVSERKSPPVEEKPAAQTTPEEVLRRQTRDQFLEILKRS